MKIVRPTYSRSFTVTPSNERLVIRSRDAHGNPAQLSVKAGNFPRHRILTGPMRTVLWFLTEPMHGMPAHVPGLDTVAHFVHQIRWRNGEDRALSVYEQIPSG